MIIMALRGHIAARCLWNWCVRVTFTVMVGLNVSQFTAPCFVNNADGEEILYVKS